MTAVYEALSHRRAATRSYVWLHFPIRHDNDDKEEPLASIRAEAKRHGIGVFVGEDPADYGTWEELVEAVRTEPDPWMMNEFIKVQFSPVARDKILTWMR